MTPWVTTAEADAYFADRLGAASYWMSATEKTAALRTAQRDIEAHPYTFDAVSDSAPADDPMKEAVYEQALFRLMDTDVDARASLRAQGVIQAGPIEETYQPGDGLPPLCARAVALLKSYRSDTACYIPWDT